MTPLRAIVFDLYGTLLHLRETVFQRGIARLVAAPRREWVEFLRHELVVRSYASREAFVDAILERFPPRGERSAVRQEALALLEREIASARPEPSARSLLGFLRRRGLKLAVLTNSASPFHEPFEAQGWRELFDAVEFSCDLGVGKPEPAAYRAVLTRLGVEPSEALMVGDSLANDVRGPAALGLRTLLVGESERTAAVPSFADLAWQSDWEGGASALLARGRRVRLGDGEGTLARIDLLPDGVQGRYNLVAAAEVAWDDGLLERVYLKRFRHPESVWLEQFVRPLLGEVGIATNRVGQLAGSEPVLIARAVTGEKLVTGPPEPELAFEMGRHGASAFLFANADFRPRNAFLTHHGRRPCLTMVDYEYTLFDRALDLSDLPERFDPRALAKRPEAELLARGGRRVLTPATLQRARRAFFDHRTVAPEVVEAFRDGFREVHAAARSAARRLAAMLADRLEREPPLVIGTESYRRAFLPLDARDLLARVAMDPDVACGWAF